MPPRAEPDFVEEISCLAVEEGVNRIRFADTLGIMDPISMFRIITRLKTSFSIDIGVHTHNDFGMATANAVAALKAGADFADVTVSGLGERAARIPLSPRRPVVGEDIFTCESGIHIDGIIKNPSNYEPFDPAEVSLRRKFLIGKKAGRSVLRYKLRSLKINTEDRVLEKLLMKLKNESSRLKTSFSDKELLRCASMLSQ